MPWWKSVRESRLLRVPPGLESDPKFRCCGCCHVQTGTVCLGLYNVMLQLVCMSVLVFAILHPDMLQQRFVSQGSDTQLSDKLALEMPEPAVDDRFDQSLHRSTVLPRRTYYSKQDMLLFTQKRIKSGDAHLALALVFGLLFITSLMIYGAIKSRPVYLLPFFCFQVFDFILACLTAVGHYTWLPNIHRTIAENPDIPFRDHLLRVNSQWVALWILLLYVLVLLVKAYFIGVVWACYQYLHIRNATVTRYAINDLGMMYADSADAELLLPPNYETASKMPPNYPGPPPEYVAN